MTLRTPPSWLQGGSHSAENDRLTAYAGTLSAGIIGTNDLVVAAHGTPNMSVDVAAGAAIVKGSLSSFQGFYKVYNDALVNLSIAAADPTNARIDLVVVTVNDAQYSGATNTCVLQVVTGTPAGSPTAPAAPANSYILAQVAVAAAASSIVAGNITDKRARFVEAPQTFQADVASAAALIARGTTSQTGSLLECQDVNNNVLAKVTSAGEIRTINGVTVGDSVSAQTRLWGTNGAPSSGLGSVGDFAFNFAGAAGSRIYIKTSSSVWTGIV